jgi:hypothetical protein
VSSLPNQASIAAKSYRLLQLLVPWSDPLFGKPGCYVDIVSDISAPQWHRFYVGQSVGLYSRIRQHLSAIQDRNSARLHHYVASRPGRRSTFIITTDVNPSGLSTQQFELLLDIVEMAQALALQSLPEATLVAYLPPRNLDRKSEYLFLGFTCNV